MTDEAIKEYSDGAKELNDWYLHEQGKAYDEYKGKELDAKLDEIYNSYNEEVEKLERKFWDNVEIGDGVTLTMWTDREAYTVIKKTPCTITIQRDKAELDPSWKPKYDMYYCYNNNDQKWVYERDPEGMISILHWSKKYHCYRKYGYRSVSYGRSEFYDYNF